MTKEVSLKNDTVILDSEVKYSGKDAPSDQDRLVRKAIGLPLTKGLVYYKDIYDASSITSVDVFRLVEMYDITDSWYTIELSLTDGSVVRIHSSYFLEMQKSTFVTDMAVQSQKVGM